jgi:hypothetical protein
MCTKGRHMHYAQKGSPPLPPLCMAESVTVAIGLFMCPKLVITSLRVMHEDVRQKEPFVQLLLFGLPSQPLNVKL